MNKKITSFLLAFVPIFLLFWCGKYISKNQVKNIVTNFVGVSPENVRFLEVELDREDWIYDVEFIANGVKYDYEVDAINWTVLIENDDIQPQKNPEPTPNILPEENTNYLSRNEVETTVAIYMGEAIENIRFLEIEFDREELDYDVDFIVNGIKYECEVDAINWNIRFYD